MVSITTSLTTLLGACLLASTANAACSDVELVFARGTNEDPGLGKVGGAFLPALKTVLPGKSVSSYAVEYKASADQSSAGPGATVMSKYITQAAAACPSTIYVIGGYSQGASVTDIAIGIKTILGSGETIPTALAPRIKAVVTFGNPLGLLGSTIAKQSALYGAKSVDDCNAGDPVCGAGLNVAAHLAYSTDGSAPAAAAKVAKLVLGTTRSLRGAEDDE
jgi:cutinase